MVIAVRPMPALEALITRRGDQACTWQDIRELPTPEDGRRIELIDGAVIVTPAPAYLHQRAAHRIALILEASCPRGYEVFGSPPDWVPNELNSFIPDALVVPVMTGAAVEFRGTPLLAVEVLSPSTRHWDLGTKRWAYETAGLGWYWVVDPLEPSITVFRLQDGRLVEHARAAGSEPYDSLEPLVARVVPEELVAPRA